MRQRAFGDADAVSFGDYHVAKDIGWALTGTAFDDDELREFLEPYRPHRGRVQAHVRPRRPPPAAARAADGAADPPAELSVVPLAVCGMVSGVTVITDPGAELREMLGALPSYAVTHRLDQVRAVLRVEVVRGRERLATATARIADGDVVVLDDGSDPTPDVVLRAGSEVLAGIVRGELNSGLEYVRGTLDIEGDTGGGARGRRHDPAGRHARHPGRPPRPRSGRGRGRARRGEG